MTRGATARLFVAVDPPQEVREELVAWARRALQGTRRRAGAPGGGARLLEADALHLTLCFLGGRPAGEIEQIAEALSRCAPVLGELSLGAPLWLPPRRPRVLAVEVHDHDEELQRLHDSVSAAISEAIGWQRERRRFRAHITVARMRGSASRRPRRERGGDAAAHASQPSLPATPALRFTPAAVVLYRSWLSPSGASYEALAARELAGAER